VKMKAITAEQYGEITGKKYE
ncbi:XkdX family protein, partial [Ligilactobacillus murinus]|nr:XkdX family protein [Ligilactobacillus murinus]